ncbi:calponin homology domain-containing protein [Phascolomyces articulosus]|uniref:Calponin homology domain-containing protein n=1 Tax=Phascolomyces articulosus TaxID=60185 RepID=A0AAD5K234_9FUNG|nr:calponin homology domain-containing protein [Phascolomyces articulosus]
MAPLFGIDREIHRKIQSKYSTELEQEAREWIESVIEAPLPSDDFHESLKDGVILCKMIGKLVPGEGKYKDSKIPFMQMENISKFLAGAEKLGVPKHDLFQTVDLYEKKNMTQVVDSIFALSRYAHKAGTCSSYLGPKLAEKHVVEFSEETLNAGKAYFNTAQYGYSKGASQAGIIFGARREISNVRN